jgi:hypothetical protein
LRQKAEVDDNEIQFMGDNRSLEGGLGIEKEPVIRRSPNAAAG